MSFENIFNVGDVVKSFDFNPAICDSYIVAKILEAGPSAYTVKVIKSVSDSDKFDALRKNAELTIPYEMMVDFLTRITLVADKDTYELLCSEVPEAA